MNKMLIDTMQFKGMKGLDKETKTERKKSNCVTKHQIHTLLAHWMDSHSSWQQQTIKYKNQRCLKGHVETLHSAKKRTLPIV
jgi:hypothetical protein